MKSEFRDEQCGVLLGVVVAEFRLKRQRSQLDTQRMRTLKTSRRDVVFDLKEELISGQLLFQIARWLRSEEFDTESESERGTDGHLFGHLFAGV